jgi:hypothetical protein
MEFRRNTKSEKGHYLRTSLKGSAMATVPEKPVKVIKRSMRNDVVGMEPSTELRTPAQLHRQMISVVSSWIAERKVSKTVPTQLFRELDT